MKKCPRCQAVKPCDFCKKPRNRIRSVRKASRNRKNARGVMKLIGKAARNGSPDRKITD
jgi:hypothetical protein